MNLDKYFDIHPSVSKLFVDDAKDRLLYDLVLYYNDALFATPEEPVEVLTKGSGIILNLFPTMHNAECIHVCVKEG